jgi:hypothetical protein
MRCPTTRCAWARVMRLDPRRRGTRGLRLDPASPPPRPAPPVKQGARRRGAARLFRVGHRADAGRRWLGGRRAGPRSCGERVRRGRRGSTQTASCTRESARRLRRKRRASTRSPPAQTPSLAATKPRRAAAMTSAAAAALAAESSPPAAPRWGPAAGRAARIRRRGRGWLRAPEADCLRHAAGAPGRCFFGRGRKRAHAPSGARRLRARRAAGGALAWCPPAPARSRPHLPTPSSPPGPRGAAAAPAAASWPAAPRWGPAAGAGRRRPIACATRPARLGVVSLGEDASGHTPPRGRGACARAALQAARSPGAPRPESSPVPSLLHTPRMLTCGAPEATSACATAA